MRISKAKQPRNAKIVLRKTAASFSRFLLSVCQTCKYGGVDFLDFLRSGEKDVHAFAEKHRRRKPAHQSTAPAMFLTGPATQAMGADESAI